MDSPRALAERIAKVGACGFEPVVRAMEGRLYRVALRILAQPAEAEDAVQDALLRAFDALSEGRFDERERLEAWLLTIVTRVCIDALRKRRVRGTAEAPSFGPAPHLDEDQLAAMIELGRWLEGLPPDQRAAVVLRFMEGLTSREVAAALGVSEGAVEQRVLRARASLARKERLEPA